MADWEGILRWMWDGAASREGNLLASPVGYEDTEALTRPVGGVVVTDLYATLTGREKDLLAVLMGGHPVGLLVVVVVMVVDSGSNLLARLVVVVAACEMDLTGKWAVCEAAFFGRLAGCDDLFGRLVGCDADLFTA